MKNALIQKTRFHDVWQDFVAAGISDGIPNNIRSSWERCAELGLDPRADVTAIALDENSIRRRLLDHYDFHQILQSHHDNIMKCFDFIPIAILFSDEDGYIMSRSGHDQILQLLDYGNVKTGSSIKEFSVGTTAPGICLEEGRTVGLIAEEHFYESFH